MPSERDEYIKKLMEKAEQQRRSEGAYAPKPSSARQASRTTKPATRSTAAPTGARPKARPAPRVQPAGVPQAEVGPNGRQTAEAHTAGKPATATGKPNNTAPAAPTNVRNDGARRAANRDEDHGEARNWASLGLIFVSLYLAMSTVSYLIYFQDDEYLAYFSYLFNFDVVGAQNWGGKLGAIIGNALVGRSFGVMGLGFTVVVMVWAIKVLRLSTLTMRKATRSMVTIILLGSIALGQFSGYDPQVFGSGYGGELGIYASLWLQGLLGFEGSSLLIVVGGIGTLYFINSGWINSFVRWISRTLERNRLRRTAREMVERERDEQLRARIASSNAAAMVARNAMAAAAAELSLRTEPVAPIAAPEPPKPIIQIEDPVAESVIEPEVEPIAAPKPAIDPGCLLQLQGDQWGYIFDWDISGTPIYCYLDKVALAASSVPVAAKSLVAAARPAAAVLTPEEHEIEFTIKSYDTASPAEIEAPAKPEMTIASTPAPAIGEPKKAHFAPSADDPNFIVEQCVGDDELDDRTINLTELYDPTRELASYRKPPVELLKDHSRKVSVSAEELVENKNKIVHTLETFGIRIDTIEATIGPTVTLYEIIPAPGVRISKIKNLEDDIALSLSALGIRIIAPIPGRGTIGIEVPNKEKETVSMYSVIKSAKFQESKAELPVALGKTIQNETFVLDLAKMPHLLVAGATGQGKSVGLNAILTSLLYKKHPSELKFILIDPKKVELTLYAKLEKHFLAKMPGEDEAIITDTQKVIYTLNSICVEMDARYDLLKAAKVRNISEYNDKFTHRHLNPQKGHRFLPYFVVIIDEFADLIMTAGREVETPIARIAQLARAVGIHLIIATQRPTTNIITGVIKANFPARIAFRVTSMIDSRTILDSPGANQLVGRGDMLVSTGSEVTRVQCAFVDTPEVDDITEFISSQRGYTSAYELPEYVPESEQSGLSRDVDSGRRDTLFEEVAHYVVSNQSGSASTIQRKFSIGFNRAGRLIDQLEAAGIVGRADGSKPRQVLIQDLISLEMILE